MMSSSITPSSSPSKKDNMFARIKSALAYEPAVGENPPAYLFFKHRYFRAFIFLLMCLLNTLVYYGWQPFSKMLYRSGAYRWHCDESTLASRDDYCLDQKDSVQALFQIGMSSEFIAGVFSGICLDYFGPWLTGFIGSSFFVGWMCLIYSSESFQAYIPGMIFLAGSVNFIAFPCLCLGDLFPKYNGLAISLVVAAQTTGTAVAPIMKLVWDANPTWTYDHIVWGYLGVAFFPTTFFYLLSVPWTRLAVKEFVAVSAKDDVDALSVSTADNDKSPAKKIEAPTINSSTSHVDEIGLPVAEPVAAVSTIAISPTSIVHPPRPLFKQILTVEYIMFTAYYILQLLQFGYFPTTVDVEFGPAISDFQGYILPAQGAFGALFGLMVDKTTTLPICVSLIVMMTTAYVTALIRSTGLQYFTSILYVISNSYIYTVKYTYVAEMFPPTYFGILIGLIGCIAGVAALLNIPIGNANEYVITCIAYIVVGGITLIIVVFLMFRKKKGIHYRIDPKQLKESEDPLKESEDQLKVDEKVETV